MTTGSNPQSLWNLMTGKQYDPDMIFSKSTDSNGHYERTSVKMAPQMMAELQAFIASRVIPQYRTVEDFIRDAMLHRMEHWRQSMGLPQNAVFTAEMVGSQIEQRKALYATWDHQIENIASHAEQMMALMDLDNCAMFLQEQEHNVEESDMPPVLRAKFDEMVAGMYQRVKMETEKARKTRLRVVGDD